MTEEEKDEIYNKAFEIACSNRVLSSNDPTINAIFKEVKKTLGNDIVSRIEHLDRNKVIIIVCSDNNLTKGIVDYIWYTHPPELVSRDTEYSPRYISLRYRNYSRWTEEQIMSDLFQWQISLKEVTPFGGHKYAWDYIQFLQDIKTEHLKVFQRLLGISRDYKLGNERILIVSTDKVDNLPQELSRQFELIKPELGKRDTAQEAIELKYDKDRHILFINEKHLQLTGDKKNLIQYLFEGRKAIDLLRNKIAQSKGKNKEQYTGSTCRKLITKTNEVIEKEFSIKDFIRNEKNKSGFYCLTPKPKEGFFKGNIEVIQR